MRNHWQAAYDELQRKLNDPSLICGPVTLENMEKLSTIFTTD